MNKGAKIYVAGHRGMVGSAITRLLTSQGYRNILTRTRNQLDLLNQAAVNDFLNIEKPDYIFIAAAKVGGIQANNTYRADFIYQNLMIECNLINGAHQAGINHLTSLGSSCIYPRNCPQPIKEEYLLSGPLEETNRAYAIAKIAGIELLNAINYENGTNHFTVMPCNLFGPNDNFSESESHVLPAMIRKFHDAKVNSMKSVELWGSGEPLREFLHSSDLAEGIIFALQNYKGGGIINIGSGSEISIKNLALLISEIVGFQGEIFWNTSKPDGTPRKLLDVERLKSLGWQNNSVFSERIESTYKWFLKDYDEKE
jgi:GDP-L-fucose synthase